MQVLLLDHLPPLLTVLMPRNSIVLSCLASLSDANHAMPVVHFRPAYSRSTSLPIYWPISVTPLLWKLLKMAANAFCGLSQTSLAFYISALLSFASNLFGNAAGWHYLCSSLAALSPCLKMAIESHSTCQYHACRLICTAEGAGMCLQEQREQQEGLPGNNECCGEGVGRGPQRPLLHGC